ncbi:MAG TPA: GNAT family N-acetyltransferase [Actinomycetes bacterium]|nr:GNAT family N-acetyltransferase [Actinomycetes bacterium]
MADDDDARTRVVDNPERHRFELLLDDAVVGFVLYRLLPGRIVFIHTEIQPEFEGRGLGSRLASAVLDTARSRGLAVVPDCPFISAYIRDHPEYADLVQHDHAG